MENDQEPALSGGGPAGGARAGSVQVRLGGETAKNADVQTSVEQHFLKVMLIVLLGVMLVLPGAVAAASSRRSTSWPR